MRVDASWRLWSEGLETDVVNLKKKPKITKMGLKVFYDPVRDDNCQLRKSEKKKETLAFECSGGAAAKPCGSLELSMGKRRSEEALGVKLRQRKAPCPQVPTPVIRKSLPVKHRGKSSSAAVQTKATRGGHDSGKGGVDVAIPAIPVRPPESMRFLNPRDLDFCILCGSVMDVDVEKRYKQLQFIASLLSLTCAKTPFVYQHIMGMAKDERRAHRVVNRRRGEGCVQNCHCGVGGDEVEEAKWPRSTLGHMRGDQFFVGCGKGNRSAMCVACINWVRRQSKGVNDMTSLMEKRLEMICGGGNGYRCKGVDKYFKNNIPLDNLLMFLQDPGSTPEPDKRSLYRLLQNMSIQYSGVCGGHELLVRNCYMAYQTPMTQRVVDMFKRRYFRSYDFDASIRHLWKGMRCQKPGFMVSCEETVHQKEGGGAKNRVSKQQKQPGGKVVDCNTEMINDIIKIWWETNGMPDIFEHRVTAKHVRRMLRNGPVTRI
mmetsp:Transcript_42702/g.83534  ORF Transcript_42702/g.83534 Transcript_42702/m.83534 type:complete len:486 (+) Transcript_42702:272-1729(+)